MLFRPSVVPALVLSAVLSQHAFAQDKQKEDKAPNVSAHLLPAAGMCRVWLKDVPAAQQPAPTDCAAAIRNRPADAQVLFGEPVSARDSRGMTPGWNRRANFGFANKGTAAVQVPAVTRTAAPDPVVQLQVAPTKAVAPKPEKPQ